MERIASVFAALVVMCGMTTPTALGSRSLTTVARGWATVAFEKVTGSCARYAADGITVYRRIDGGWDRRFAGSSGSCPISGVPEAVRKDLRLPCPERGG